MHHTTAVGSYEATETIVIERLPRSFRILAGGASTTRRPYSAAGVSVDALAPTARKKSSGWSRARLDDLAYDGRKYGRTAAAPAKAATGAGAASGGGSSDRPRRSASRDAAAVTGTFLERAEAVTARVEAARRNAALMARYETVDKKICPNCRREQTFEEWAKRTTACNRSDCATSASGATFRPKVVWEEVAPAFLGRLSSTSTGKRPASASLTARSLSASGRRPSSAGLGASSSAGAASAAASASPPLVWRDVAAEFFERQEEWQRRHAETLEEMAEERKRQITEEAEKLQGSAPKLNTTFAFTTEPPPFEERQRAAADRKKLSWEERMEEYREKTETRMLAAEAARAAAAEERAAARASRRGGAGDGGS